MKSVFLVSVLLVLTACSMHCTKDKVNQIWTEVSSQYPGCTQKPNIIEVDNGMMGGFYLPEAHTVVIDKWSLPGVWRHEFRHACGDDLHEGQPVALHGSTLKAMMFDYMKQTNQIADY